jgi:hypothetical protein
VVTGAVVGWGAAFGVATFGFGTGLAFAGPFAFTGFSRATGGGVGVTGAGVAGAGCTTPI